jgi:predicted O-methyltransferase YrrM
MHHPQFKNRKKLTQRFRLWNHVRVISLLKSVGGYDIFSTIMKPRLLALGIVACGVLLSLRIFVTDTYTGLLIGLALICAALLYYQRRTIRIQNRDAAIRSAEMEKRQNELVTAIELKSNELTETLEAIKRSGETIEYRLASAERAILKARKERNLVRRFSEWLIAQINQEAEAMIQLHQLIAPRHPTSSMGGPAIDPKAMLHIVELVLQNKPDLIVECGSGTSTLWLAYALERAGHGRLITLEHSVAYAEPLREQLKRHDLETLVDFRVAPLENHVFGSESYEWYASSTISDIEGVQLLIIDGPPGTLAPMARYPAIPLLLPRLADSALVIFDDAERAGEIAIRKRWFEENVGLQEPRSIGRNTVEFRVVK